MRRKLGPKTRLETLRKDAKRWLRALRAGEPDALQRLRAAWPEAPAAPVLRDVQHALAREYGLAGWAELKGALEDLAIARGTDEERANAVLVSPWSGGDLVVSARIARRHPELARHSLHTAIAFGDLEEVGRRLEADPSAARRKGGPRDWEPLLYLAYSRVPAQAVSDNALAIADLLLDAGADPNAGFSDDWDNPFKVLTGVIGLGEGVHPPHPKADALAERLIERGADPFDTQALYNTSIVGDEVVWLERLWRASAARGEDGRWRAVGGLGAGVGISTLDYLLGNAVSQNHLRRAEWLLQHGADPNGRNGYSPDPHHKLAQLAGLAHMTGLLERYGARPAVLTEPEALLAACVRRDLPEIRRLAALAPEAVRDPAPLLAAAHGGPEVVALLLELGASADLAEASGRTALHMAASVNAVDAARVLLAAGADVNRRGSQYQATPFGFACHFGHPEMIELLEPFSRDVIALTAAGRFERLRQVLGSDPSLANAVHPLRKVPVLFALPNDEDQAAAAAQMLLSFGADAQARGPDGETADQAAARRGLDEAAEIIRAARQMKRNGNML